MRLFYYLCLAAARGQLNAGVMRTSKTQRSLTAAPRAYPSLLKTRTTAASFAIGCFLFSAWAAGQTTCPVPGGSSSNDPVAISQYVNDLSRSEVLLGDGYYSFPTITRSGITIRAAQAGSAHVVKPFAISGSNVTIDGIAFEGLARCIEVRAPGAVIRHSSFSQFAKAHYGYAIHVLDEGMNPTNVTVIESNTFDEWGGAPHSAAVILGTHQGAPYVYDSIAGHVLNNRFTRGPTAKQAASAGNSAIQAFEPFLARGNYIHTVTGPAIQNKTRNSVISCNTIIECRGGWGALYNRALGNNKWMNNVVMDSETGFDHFAGDDNVFSGNVFYNVAYMGRIKNFQSGSHNLVIENNTFCLSSGWTGFVWDPNSGGTFSHIVWRNNIFYSIKGRVISWRGDYDASIWDEHSNVFWQSTRPSQPTTGSTGSSVVADPQFEKIPSSFVVGNPALKGKGAAWPCPCADTPSPR